MKRILASLFLAFYATSLFAAAVMTPEAIKEASHQWEEALASRKTEKIVDLYEKDAFLYATFENMIDTQAGLIDYFKKLMQHPELKVVFNTQNIRLYGEAAVNSGLYTFSYTENGKTVTIPARYTFVYTHRPTGWFIVDHHSSVLPE